MAQRRSSEADHEHSFPHFEESSSSAIDTVAASDSDELKTTPLHTQARLTRSSSTSSKTSTLSDDSDESNLTRQPSLALTTSSSVSAISEESAASVVSSDL